jgi:hypothetical protein
LSEIERTSIYFGFILNHYGLCANGLLNGAGKSPEERMVQNSNLKRESALLMIHGGTAAFLLVLAALLWQ